nr:hypothetical protein [Tanacetum cinerariifolium]
MRRYTESMETVHETTPSPKVTIRDGAIIPTSVGRMTKIALTIPNNKTMVTNQGMRVAIHLTSNKITNNKAPTNKGHSNTKIMVKVQAMANNLMITKSLQGVPEHPKATKSPKVGEGGLSSTTTTYPAALEKSASTRLAKKGPHSEDMWETFNQDLCTQKRKLKATLSKKIDLTEHVNAVLSSSLPPKFKDPGAPLISVVVGNIAIRKALLDLGASINILPASLVDEYGLGTLRKTDTIISFADRYTKIPRGILEDVIVKVDDFYYPVDFFVMDTESPYKDV